MNLDNSKLVSVIVPVYNVEKFLDHCIESIVGQTYSNIELILVDDGSTDSSGSLCDNWKTKDSRVVVCHQNNKGLSGARNTGIDISKGDYLCFIDSDDFVTANYVESFVNEIEATNADFVLCDIISSKFTDASMELDENRILSPEDCRNWLTNPISREYVLMVVAWNKLYKRKLFESFRFPDGKLHEDEFMINHMIYNIDKVAYISKANYVYRNNEASITGKDNANNIKHLNGVEAYEERLSIALKHNDDEFASTTLKWSLLKLAHFYKNGNDKMKHQSMEMFIRLYDSYHKILTKKQQAKYRMFKSTPGIFCKMFIQD